MRFAVLVLLAGCDLVFTFDKNPVEETVPPRTVTLTYDRTSVGAGATVTTEPVDPGFRVTKLDGTEIPVTSTGLGTAEVTTDAATYVVLTTTLFADVEIQFGGPDLRIRERVLGRSTRTPVLPNTKIDFNLMSQTASSTSDYQVYTTGLWTFDAVASPGVVHDYSKATSMSGPLGLLEPPDAVYFLHLDLVTDPDTNIPLRMLREYHVSTPTLVSGGTVPITGQFATASTSHCVRVTAPRAMELERISSVAPSSFTVAGADWVISSVPHEEMQAAGGVALVLQTMMTNVENYDVRFENPIVDSNTIVSMSASRARAYTVRDATIATSLAYVMRVFNRPIPRTTECVPQVLPVGSVGIVDSISVDGKVIRTDDQSVTVDDNIVVEWSVTPAPVDLFSVQLIEMTKRTEANGDISTIPIPRARITTIDRRVVFRGSFLEPNHYYYINVQARSGHPNAASGDLSKITYPVAVASTPSGVFQAK